VNHTTKDDRDLVLERSTRIISAARSL